MHITREEVAARLKTIKHIHFIGITSPFCSFSATALLAQGKKVTASEANQESEQAKKWIEKGVLVPGPHKAENIHEGIDLVVFPNAALPGNPEIEKTQELDLPYVMVQELLGAVSSQYKTIAIAGTHGKTTTTALIVWLLHKTIGTPNFIVGDAKDRIAELNSNWEAHPESEYLVLEACEYKKQFLDRAPHPYVSVITHIDIDHTDYFPTQESYNGAFLEFLDPTQFGIVIDGERPNELAVLTEYKGKAKILPISKLREQFGHIASPLFGHHNQENLLRAAGVGVLLGLSQKEIETALSTFPGISSRFELKGKMKNGALVYRDFAHNPQKITACLQGAKEAFPDKQIVMVYQPHNHERTSSFLPELVESLKNTDVIIIPNIYSARESEEQKALISSEFFAQRVQDEYRDKEVVYTNDTAPYTETEKLIREYDNADSLILLVSAGDLDKIVPSLLS